MRTRARLLSAIGLLVALSSCSNLPNQNAPLYDLVIQNGHVMDPESGLDAVRAVGISGGSIRAISERPLQGRETLDARGMVVAPGFIDLHQHAQDPAGYGVEALDGTTTALELEGGTLDVDSWYDTRVGKSIINHGVGVGHDQVRMLVMHDPGKDAPTGAAKSRASTPAEMAEIVAIVDRCFRRGAISAGMWLEYTPATTPWEVVQVFKVAAKYGASVHVHMRALGPSQYFLETEEVIAASAATGAAAHIVHINSSLAEDAPLGLELIRGARARGLDITTEVYPYTTSMSPITGADTDDWQTWPDRKFQHFQWAATGEKLTRESFARYRAMGGYIIEELNTEEAVTAVVADPLTMIASDGILHDGVGHPRVAGTYARVLGHYVRELHALTLMDALRKSTIEPARRMERRVPSMALKGRLKVGADADLVVFDPNTIIDKATYRAPTLPPLGLRDVLVNGVIVVRNGAVQSGVFPGRAVRAQIQ